jgi:hypothetical protein
VFSQFLRQHHSVTNWTGKRRFPPDLSKITAKGKPEREASLDAVNMS